MHYLQMPRVYVRKTKRQSWTETQLKNAKSAIELGMSTKKAARLYGIPRSTLIGHTTGTGSTKLGSKTCVFTPDQEQELVRHLLDLENRFYGITMTDVRRLAFELAKKTTFRTLSTRKRKLLVGIG